MEGRSVWEVVRSSLFSRANREFLIFLFFLALSGVFWLMLTLNETYEREIAVPVRIVNIPKEVMLTSDDTDTMKVTLRDRGLVVFGFVYGDLLRPLNISFRTYDQGNGECSVSGQDLVRMLSKQLPSSTKVVGTSTSKLHYYYNTGAHKRVPVRWSGRVIPEQLYFLSSVEYSPDSVTVYASEERLDSIKTVYTEVLNYVGFRDTLTVDCQLRKQEGVKTVPDHVRVRFFTDVLTEATVDEVPVRGVNMPKGKVLRTFPAKVSVSFVTGVSVLRGLKASDFVVVADYQELKNNPSDKCKIYLRKVPADVSRASLSVAEVDYLIEDVTPDEE